MKSSNRQHDFKRKAVKQPRVGLADICEGRYSTDNTKNLSCLINSMFGPLISQSQFCEVGSLQPLPLPTPSAMHICNYPKLESSVGFLFVVVERSHYGVGISFFILQGFCAYFLPVW